MRWGRGRRVWSVKLGLSPRPSHQQPPLLFCDTEPTPRLPSCLYLRVLHCHFVEVAGKVELGELLCDDLDDALGSVVLRFALSSTEVRTSFADRRWAREIVSRRQTPFKPLRERIVCEKSSHKVVASPREPPSDARQSGPFCRLGCEQWLCSLPLVLDSRFANRIQHVSSDGMFRFDTPVTRGTHHDDGADSWKPLREWENKRAQPPLSRSAFFWSHLPPQGRTIFSYFRRNNPARPRKAFV